MTNTLEYLNLLRNGSRYVWIMWKNKIILECLMKNYFKRSIHSLIVLKSYTYSVLIAVRGHKNE